MDSIYAILVPMIITLGLFVAVMLFVGRRIVSQAEKEASAIVAQAKSQVNQFASLPPDKLNAEFARVWTAIVSNEIIANISVSDAAAEEELYLRALKEFVEYFSGSIQAIELRYGKDYVIKWFSLHYETMQADGTIHRIIQNKSSTSPL